MKNIGDSSLCVLVYVFYDANKTRGDPAHEFCIPDEMMTFRGTVSHFC